MTDYFEFQMSVKICSGTDAAEHLPFELRALNCTRPLIVTDKTLVGLGLLKIVTDALGADAVYDVFDDVPQDSGLDTVETAAAVMREKQCDGLIALGGGSVLDTAKGVRLLVSSGAQKVTDIIGCEEMKRGAYVPFIAVPTTSGTGSEATAVAVIADRARGVKLEFITDKMQPDAAILDPRLTEKLPARLTASTAADALCHAIEAYSCRQKNPVSDAFALVAIRLIAANVKKAVEHPSDKAARLALANASFMAGAAFSNSMVGGVHAIGHALGGVCHVPHGDAMAVLLPHVMAYNADKCTDDYAALLPVLTLREAAQETSVETRAQAAVKAVNALLQDLHAAGGLPVRLAETGRVKETDFDAVVQKAVNDGALLFNPKAMTERDVIDILKQAF